MNRKLTMLRLLLQKGGLKRANYLKKNKVFYYQGENCFYQPWKIPSEPHLLSIHNNVVITAGVNFITHDIICHMLANAEEYSGRGKYDVNYGKIDIYDNVFIGAYSTIMYNVKIGPNAIIAAGSIVTKDVEPGTIVGGNPAKVIGYVEDLAYKRLNTNSNSI